MRIVAGTHRGRRLEAPEDQRIRPTSDRIRESLFNILEHRMGGLKGLRVLDGFAGTGALGLEALSRGADWVDFIDSDRTALALCRRNAAALGLADRAHFHFADLGRPPRATTPCDLLLLDPPYGKNLATSSLPALVQAGWCRMGTVVVVEADRAYSEAVPPDFVLIDQRDYGRTRITLLLLDRI
jgi:16S rRNA (guanine966-N2)-methyltransferase